MMKGGRSRQGAVGDSFTCAICLRKSRNEEVKGKSVRAQEAKRNSIAQSRALEPERRDDEKRRRAEEERRRRGKEN
ncbi:hypothetical protein MTO96_029357 [Rhipicephalus appendiculatus]